jgi:serine/threonine-protein kinase
LEAVLAAERFALARAVRMAMQIACGLAAAHEVEVVHRDLKPANVLLHGAGSDQERVVITDFGIARAPREVALTHVQGAFVGTPAYMSPEQVMGEVVDAKSDVYSLGLVLYEMLTGQLPFLRDNTSVIAVAMARCRQAPEDPRALAAIPDALAEIVLYCLQLNPADRPSGTAEVALRLERWLSTSSGVHGGDLASLHLGATVVADRDSSPVFATAPSGAGRGPSFRPGPLPQASSSSASMRASGAPLHSAAGPDTRGVSSDPRVSSSPFAPIPTLQLALAVLPFRYRGPDSEGYFADALWEELIDVLSATGGLRVLSSGATARFRDVRDPRAVGSELGVDAVIDATVQRGGGGLRITVRLIDVASGVQTWSERYETTVEDALAVQDTMSRRIAEALRLEIVTARPGDDTPAEAVELYLNARRQLRAREFSDWETPIQMLEAALALAPTFRVAMGAHAVACVRAWWASAPRRDWGEVAKNSVARARSEAPEMAESHLAAGMLAVNLGDLSTAAVELAQALDIAPTFADAHAYLGQIQCEAGRVDEGLKRLQLTLEIDPEHWSPHMTMARVSALRGDRAKAEQHLAELAKLRGDRGIAYFSTRVRLAAWWRDYPLLRELVEHDAGSSEPARAGLIAVGRYVLGGEDATPAMRDMMKLWKNPRMISLVLQLSAEGYGLRGETELALECVREASAAALVDVEWLKRCPALEELRKHPGFQQVYNEVYARAMGIWKV